MKKEILDYLIAITDEEQQFLDGKSNIDKSIYMESGKNVINAKKLLKSGKLITIRPHSRFIHFPEHTHDYVEMVYMCKGSTTHLVNGKEIILEQGETLILNQHAK